MKTTRLLSVLVILALALAVSAQAASLKTPPLGAWKFDAKGTGFTLKRSGNKVVATNIHYVTTCSEKTIPIKVLGKFPIKTFTRGGYTTWGIGKNDGGNPALMPAKVRSGGKTYNGSFYLVWNYANFSQLLGGDIEYPNCSNYVLRGSHG